MGALWGLLEGCGEFREAEREVPELGQISGESGGSAGSSECIQWYGREGSEWADAGTLWDNGATLTEAEQDGGEKWRPQ